MTPSTALTVDAALALKDDTNYTILVSCPVLHILQLATVAETDLCGFRKRYEAQLTDGENTVSVVLPADFKLYGTGPSFDVKQLKEGDVITLLKMIRLPVASGGHKNTTVVCTEVEVVPVAAEADDDQPLTITNYDAEIAQLRGELRIAQDHVRRLHGLGRVPQEVVALALELAEQLTAATDNVIGEHVNE